MKKKIFIVFIILSVLLTAEGIRKMWLIDSRYGLDIGLRGDTLKVITWVDPQTNIEYLIFEDKGYKSLGLSVVPRLNADGTLRIVK